MNNCHQLCIFKTRWIRFDFGAHIFVKAFAPNNTSDSIPGGLPPVSARTEQNSQGQNARNATTPTTKPFKYKANTQNI